MIIISAELRRRTNITRCNYSNYEIIRTMKHNRTVIYTYLWTPEFRVLCRINIYIYISILIAHAIIHAAAACNKIHKHYIISLSLSICMCIYIYIYIYICMCVYIYIYIYSVATDGQKQEVGNSGNRPYYYAVNDILMHN